MAQYQTADGRWIVGNVSGDSNYHGFLGWRDCVIQLTADGATEQSVRYLEALRDYAMAHNPLGEPIMPPSINVWISNNGTTTAVQADDLSIDGDKFTIGGIVWNGSAWDYSDAGQVSGGSGYTVTEGRSIIVQEQTAETQTYTDYARIYLTDISVMAPDKMPNTLIATYNGNEYRLPKVETSGNVIGYGEMNGRFPIFTTYPFAITFMFNDSAITDGNLLTPTAQTVTIKAEAVTRTIIPSGDFIEAVAKASEPFVVHLTPTAADFSGTMDKTCAEITEAYEVGREIWLDVDATTLGYEVWRVKATVQARVIGSNYGQVMAFLVNINTDPETLIFIYTDFNPTGTENKYYTRIYTLTSAT